MYKNTIQYKFPFAEPRSQEKGYFQIHEIKMDRNKLHAEFSFFYPIDFGLGPTINKRRFPVSINYSLPPKPIGEIWLCLLQVAKNQILLGLDRRIAIDWKSLDFYCPFEVPCAFFDP